MNYKSIAMEVKANNDTRKFTGYASKFGNIDLHNDIVEKGAFTKTISERHPKAMIKVLWQHMEPIGMPDVIEEDEAGLYVEGRISKTRLGDEALELMRDRVVDGMSIGYDVVKDEYDEVHGIRRLKELKLYEVSIVTWGANPEANITNVKHLQALNSIFKDDTLARIGEVKQLLDQLNDTLDAGVFATKGGNLVINMAELKAGAVLSQKNKNNLRNAMGLIEEVLKTADPEGAEKGLKGGKDEQEKFMSACMGRLQERYPDRDQRLAICFPEWEDEQKSAIPPLESDKQLKSLLEEIRSYIKQN